MMLKKWRDNTPVFIGEVKHNGTCPVIDIWCPYCNREHRHGWPHGKSKGAFPRVSHCTNQLSPYYMKDILIQNQDGVSKAKRRSMVSVRKLEYNDLKDSKEKGWRGYSDRLDIYYMGKEIQE